MLTRITKQEELFSEWLKEHHLGIGKAVKAKHLRHWGSKREIRHMTHNLRMAGYPICSGQHGYFYAKTSSEMVTTLNFLKGILKNTEEVYYGLSETYYEMKLEEGGRE